jgi:hypothetical protein
MCPQTAQCHISLRSAHRFSGRQTDGLTKLGEAFLQHLFANAPELASGIRPALIIAHCVPSPEPIQGWCMDLTGICGSHSFFARSSLEINRNEVNTVSLRDGLHTATTASVNSLSSSSRQQLVTTPASLQTIWRLRERLVVRLGGKLIGALINWEVNGTRREVSCGY